MGHATKRYSTRLELIGNWHKTNILTMNASIDVYAVLGLDRLVYGMNYEYVGDVYASNQCVSQTFPKWRIWSKCGLQLAPFPVQRISADLFLCIVYSICAAVGPQFCNVLPAMHSLT